MLGKNYLRYFCKGRKFELRGRVVFIGIVWFNIVFSGDVFRIKVILEV